jgi:5-methylthioadenosine/S-adenosylhomocysteine deaminase
MTILIRNGTVVLGRAGARRYESADVLIDGERIAAIGARLAAPEGAETIEAGKSIVMPGLVNAHMHSNESYEQGAYDNLPLELWLLESYTPFGFPLLGPRDHYLRAMACALQSIRAGVTTVQDDIVYPPSTPDAVDQAMRAYADSGMRAWVTTDLWDRPFLECLPFVREIIPAPLQRELEALPMLSCAEQIALFERHFANWHEHDGRLRVILAPCGPQRCSEELLREVRRLSDKLDVPIHSHVLETRLQAVQAQMMYGSSLIEYLERIGLLGPRLTLIHAIWLTARDIELLAAHGCSVVHNPLSNMKLGSGVCPVRALLDAGVNVALGTDGMTTSDTADLIEAIRAASLLHKISGADCAEWLSADEVFDMATIAGARSGLMDKEVGSLAPGKRADLVLLDREAWGFLPHIDPVRQLAFAGNAEAVRTSIINGRVVMRDRRILTVDEHALKAEFAEAAARFWRDHVPKMRAGAKRLEPHMREMCRRGMSQPVTVAADPRRAPPSALASTPDPV